MTGAGGGTTALLHVELRRAIRNKRTLIFSAVLPVIFFLAFSSGGGNDRLDGLSVAPYVMTSMAVYGVMNALFTGGGLIAPSAPSAGTASCGSPACPAAATWRRKWWPPTSWRRPD